jgi:P4 family phage/plasmid primase-like protien
MPQPPTTVDLADAKRYIDSFRIPKEKKGIITPNVTGLSTVAGSTGSFHIPDEEYESFLENIASFVFGKNVPLGLVERPTQETSDIRLTPVKIDLDFRFPFREPFIDATGRPVRQFTDVMIQKFVHIYWEELSSVVSFDEYIEPTITFYVLTKSSPEIDVAKGSSDVSGKKIKDGVHIVAKDIQTLPEIQLYVRKRVLKRMGEVFPKEFTEITSNSAILDEAVICRSGWMLHGNCKEGKEAYALKFRQIYNIAPHTSSSAASSSAPSSGGGAEARDKEKEKDKEYEIIVNTRISSINDRDLVKILSIRHGIRDMGISIQEEALDDLRKFFDENSTARNNARLSGARSSTGEGALSGAGAGDGMFGFDFAEDNFTADRTEILRSAAWLVDMLSPERATPYDTWVRVGICLRNMGRIENLPDIRRGTIKETMGDDHEIIVDNGMYNLWVSFSRKSPKYMEGAESREDWYNKYWLAFSSRSSSDAMLKRPSLRLWARQDSPERFSKFLEKDERAEMNRVINGGGTHVDLAGFARLLYGDTFICADIKANEWYEYQQSFHRFVKSDSATTLRGKLSTEIRGKFATKLDSLIREITEEIRGVRGDSAQLDPDGNPVAMASELAKTKSPLDDSRVKTVNRIISSLATTKFLNDVLTECKHKFYETYRNEFLERIDTNKNLLGFNNGVLDLATCTFRPGRPDDMITKTTGYDYIDYDEDNDRVQLIYDIYRKIYTSPSVREYTWAIMSTNLRGENWRQEVYFLNGTGANGKSLNILWMSKALGDYAVKGNVTLLTDKRSGAQSASPEIAKLKGARFVHMEEPEDSASTKINHSLLKELSGGGTLTGRALYGQPITFPISFRIWFACNEFPEITSEDATWRRLRAIEHLSRFLPRDRPIADPEFQFHRKEELMSEDFVKDYRGAMMSILVHYYRKYWMNAGNSGEGEGSGGGGKSGGDEYGDKAEFHEPDEVKKFCLEIRKKNDVISQRFDDLFEPIPQAEFEMEIKPDPVLAKNTLLTSKKIASIIDQDRKANVHMYADAGRVKGKIDNKRVVNYVENICGIRGIRLDDGQTYYLVRESPRNL